MPVEARDREGERVRGRGRVRREGKRAQGKSLGKVEVGSVS